MKCVLFPSPLKLNLSNSTLWPLSLLCVKIFLVPISELHSCLYKIFILLSHITAVSVNESCFFNEQCETSIPQTECRDGRCICRFDKTPVLKKDGSIECMGKWFILIFSRRKWNILPEIIQWYTYLPFLVYLFLFWIIAIKQDAPAPPSQINPTMILILIVMALMFIIICVVLRLFSK